MCNDNLFFGQNINAPYGEEKNILIKFKTIIDIHYSFNLDFKIKILGVYTKRWLCIYTIYKT